MNKENNNNDGIFIRKHANIYNNNNKNITKN